MRWRSWRSGAGRVWCSPPRSVCWRSSGLRVAPRPTTRGGGAAPTGTTAPGRQLPQGFPEDLRRFVAGTDEFTAASWFTDGPCRDRGGDLGAYVAAMFPVEERLIYWQLDNTDKAKLWPARAESGWDPRTTGAAGHHLRRRTRPRPDAHGVPRRRHRIRTTVGHLLRRGPEGVGHRVGEQRVGLRLGRHRRRRVEETLGPTPGRRHRPRRCLGRPVRHPGRARHLLHARLLRELRPGARCPRAVPGLYGVERLRGQAQRRDRAVALGAAHGVGPGRSAAGHRCGRAAAGARSSGGDGVGRPVRHGESGRQVRRERRRRRRRFGEQTARGRGRGVPGGAVEPGHHRTSSTRPGPGSSPSTPSPRRSASC